MLPRTEVVDSSCPVAQLIIGIFTPLEYFTHLYTHLVGKSLPETLSNLKLDLQRNVVTPALLLLLLVAEGERSLVVVLVPLVLLLVLEVELDHRYSPVTLCNCVSASSTAAVSEDILSR